MRLLLNEECVERWSLVDGLAVAYRFLDGPWDVRGVQRFVQTCTLLGDDMAILRIGGHGDKGCDKNKQGIPK